MPVRPFNRQQSWLFPPTLDEMIPDDHAVRFIAAFVDNLGEADWRELEINVKGEPLGSPTYDPRALLSVWLYGFMTGTRSTRKLEAACRDEIPYLWLTGWQHPDHNTFWRFYLAHRKQIRHLFKMTVKTALNMNLIDLAIQAVDGTKVAANAARERDYDAAGLKKVLARLEKVIDEMEKQNVESNDPPPVHLPEELRKAEQLREQVKEAMRQLAANKGQKRINLTDADANLMKSRQGLIPAYNVETVVSPVTIGNGDKQEKGMMVTAITPVQDPADYKQLTPLIDQARENTGIKAEYTLADAGYHSGANLEACIQREQKILIADQEPRLKSPYHKDKFIYNPDNDTYTCPEGKVLIFNRTAIINRQIVMVYNSSPLICRKCRAFGTCTKSHSGRFLSIGPYDEYLQQHRQWMATDKAREIYARRKELIEPVFGIWKERLGFRRFLLRGLANIKAETLLMAAAFNLRTLYRAWRYRLSPEEQAAAI